MEFRLPLVHYELPYTLTMHTINHLPTLDPFLNPV